MEMENVVSCVFNMLIVIFGLTSAITADHTVAVLLAVTSVFYGVSLVFFAIDAYLDRRKARMRQTHD